MLACVPGGTARCFGFCSLKHFSVVVPQCSSRLFITTGVNKRAQPRGPLPTNSAPEFCLQWPWVPLCMLPAPLAPSLLGWDMLK